jgi:hypothetical protein
MSRVIVVFLNSHSINSSAFRYICNNDVDIPGGDPCEFCRVLFAAPGLLRNAYAHIREGDIREDIPKRVDLFEKAVEKYMRHMGAVVSYLAEQDARLAVVNARLSTKCLLYGDAKGKTKISYVSMHTCVCGVATTLM